VRGLDRPSIVPLGDAAATIRLGDEVDAALAARVQGLARRIRSAGLPYLRDVVVGYAALTVWYDALHTDFAVVADALESILRDPSPPPLSDTKPRHHLIPVAYDGPDLHEVAERTGLTVADVVARHSDRVYQVYLIGFVPGWGYLGDLDPRLVLPRRASPRTRVPAGSVAIAGAQTGVYPLTTPGGWYLLGRTSVAMFDPLADPPALLAPGDRVRFEPVPVSSESRQPKAE
jgi:KipI family sensor histidine kinase inhibitor